MCFRERGQSKNRVPVRCQLLWQILEVSGEWVGIGVARIES
jgi:hypothetical protein